jgi:ATP-binding cassette, subfamily C (CFTR/MRP), member 1
VSDPSNSSFWVSLFVAYGRPFAVALTLKFVSDILMFLQPQLLRSLLAFIARYQTARYGSNVGMFLWPATEGMEESKFVTRGEVPPAIEGFAIALLMFISASVQSVILNQYFQRVFETGMRIRSGIVSAVYNKSLVLSNEERSRRPSGDIVNLMSVDGTRLQDFCQFGLILFSGPLQIALAFASLYNLLGWPAFVGVGVMIVSIPLNTIIANIMKKMQVQQMKNRDKRTGLMNEMLNNMKSIKLYGWEFAFVKKILMVRNEQEVKMLKKIGIVNVRPLNPSRKDLC